jgi:hypothetical protein
VPKDDRHPEPIPVEDLLAEGSAPRPGLAYASTTELRGFRMTANNTALGVGGRAPTDAARPVPAARPVSEKEAAEVDRVMREVHAAALGRWHPPPVEGEGAAPSLTTDRRDSRTGSRAFAAGRSQQLDPGRAQERRPEMGPDARAARVRAPLWRIAVVLVLAGGAGWYGLSFSRAALRQPASGEAQAGARAFREIARTDSQSAHVPLPGALSAEPTTREPLSTVPTAAVTAVASATATIPKSEIPRQTPLVPPPLTGREKTVPQTTPSQRALTPARAAHLEEHLSSERFDPQ